ncbi:TPA: serine/threonine protein kinase, partial [Candidatus Latescibacteria bacterium]|nr:serine/threonine protein kinase [Candidatus Latescibacterota bacterium]
DRLFVGTQGGDLIALNRDDGSVVWKFEGGGSFTASPSVAHNRLFIGSDDGVFYCFGASE